MWQRSAVSNFLFSLMQYKFPKARSYNTVWLTLRLWVIARRRQPHREPRNKNRDPGNISILPRPAHRGSLLLYMYIGNTRGTRGSESGHWHSHFISEAEKSDCPIFLVLKNVWNVRPMNDVVKEQLLWTMQRKATFFNILLEPSDF